MRWDVCIIGAGAAGIGAARAVAAAGRSCLIVEASGRVGGRAHTVHVGGQPLDLGCGWLHSAERNPWTRLAEAHPGFTVDRTPAAWRAQWRELGFTRAERREAEAAYEAFARLLREAPPASDRAADALDPACRWNPWLQALSGYVNGASLDRLSVADYLAYDDAAGDTDWRVPQGYGALVAAHLPPVPLRLGLPVESIDLSGRGVRLDGPGIEARAAILTASTAALPRIALPAEATDHLHAAAQLPLGFADKLFLAVDPDMALPDDGHLIGDAHDAATGSYYLRPFGRPVIEAFFGGPGAERLEAEGLDGAAAFARDQLGALLGRAVAGRLRLVAGSRWRAETWVGGSYSHALPGQARQRAVLARPIGERLFFAGEATHATDFSTAHGALESGQRAAAEALAALGPAG